MAPMSSKEIILRILNHNEPPRIGFNFTNFRNNDFCYVSSRAYIDEKPNPYEHWGKHEELLKITGFSGEVCADRFGNIYGRFNGKTKGECIRGAIGDWSDFDNYTMPKLDPAYSEKLKGMALQKEKKFVLTGGCSIFSPLRDARLMANALADTALEPEMVKAFCDRRAEHEVEVVSTIAGCGFDGIMAGDDWGTQFNTFISPDSFRELFKPAYKKVFDAYHSAGIKCFMHSCGYIYNFIPDLIDAGVDAFQFDQPDAYPSEVLAEEFGRRVVFHSPIDIQKVLPTGNREIIEKRAYEMLDIFKKCGGSWIAKDYPSYDDIGVDPKWARWAEKIIVANAKI
jgi:hypothetical protein